MSTETKIEEARRLAFESEALILQSMASLRAALNEAEEENRQLRIEKARREIEIFTEREFAARLQVSDATLRRLRKRRQIEPIYVGGLVRYTSRHLEQLHEIFSGKPAGGKNLRRKREHDQDL